MVGCIEASQLSIPAVGLISCQGLGAVVLSVLWIGGDEPVRGNDGLGGISRSF
jgi:hypothetical protein